MRNVDGDYYHKGFWVIGIAGYYQIYEEVAFNMLCRGILKPPIHAVRILNEATLWIENTIKSNPLLLGLRPEYSDGLLSLPECKAILLKTAERKEEQNQ